jgi:hypothetical protein
LDRMERSETAAFRLLDIEIWEQKISHFVNSDLSISSPNTAPLLYVLSSLGPADNSSLKPQYCGLVYSDACARCTFIVISEVLTFCSKETHSVYIYIYIYICVCLCVCVCVKGLERRPLSLISTTEELLERKISRWSILVAESKSNINVHYFWKYIKCGPLLWSSGQSSWLHKGDVLCLM